MSLFNLSGLIRFRSSQHTNLRRGHHLLDLENARTFGCAETREFPIVDDKVNKIETGSRFRKIAILSEVFMIVSDHQS